MRFRVDGEGEVGVVISGFTSPADAGGGPTRSENSSLLGPDFFGDGQDLGELEVDEAKAAKFLRVGDITWLGVIVPDAVFVFEFLKKGARFFLGDERSRSATVGGDEGESLVVVADELRDVIGTTVFERF